MEPSETGGLEKVSKHWEIGTGHRKRGHRERKHRERKRLCAGGDKVLARPRWNGTPAIRGSGPFSDRVLPIATRAQVLSINRHYTESQGKKPNVYKDFRCPADAPFRSLYSIRLGGRRPRWPSASTWPPHNPRTLTPIQRNYSARGR